MSISDRRNKEVRIVVWFKELILSEVIDLRITNPFVDAIKNYDNKVTYYRFDAVTQNNFHRVVDDDGGPVLTPTHSLIRIDLPYKAFETALNKYGITVPIDCDLVNYSMYVRFKKLNSKVIKIINLEFLSDGTDKLIL